MVPEAGHIVVALAHSPTGDRVLVATSGAQPRVLDREGKELLKFVRGDMYLRDMTNTKGHTMEVTSVAWHPVDKNMVLSGSTDGTLRLWDLAGSLAFNHLVNKAVLKIRTAPGAPQGRLAVTACCFSFDGKKVIAGCADGSIHIWAPPLLTRTHILLRPAFGAGVAVTSVVTSAAAGGVVGGVLAARGADGSVLIWAMSALQAGNAQAQVPAPTPLWTIRSLESPFPAANVAFSPDGALLVAASAGAEGGSSSSSMLSFFKLDSSDAGGVVLSPCMQIIASDAGVPALTWAHATNQILCATTAGSIRVFFDPAFSTKGALLSAGRTPARAKDPLDFVAVGQIINPHALPMYRDDSHQMMGGKKKAAANEAAKLMAPAKAPVGPIIRENSSFKFTQMMAKKKVSVRGALRLSFPSRH
jgi:WD40 repeat protein